jgi:hypothetical protein
MKKTFLFIKLCELEIISMINLICMSLDVGCQTIPISYECLIPLNLVDILISLILETSKFVRFSSNIVNTCFILNRKYEFMNVRI